MKIIRKLCLILSCLLLVSFVGCKDKEKETDNTINYAKYSAMISKDFDSFTLKVTTKLDDDTLNGQYTVETVTAGKKITYSYQKINEIIEENGEYVFPEEYKSTLNGELLINGNVILSQNGEDLNLPFDKISSIGLEFEADFFENVTQTDKSFSATVVNPSGYVGRTLSCTQMTTTLRFIEDTLIKLEISYLSEHGASVYIEYSF
jgi:hypothetical protein